MPYPLQRIKDAYEAEKLKYLPKPKASSDTSSEDPPEYDVCTHYLFYGTQLNESKKEQKIKINWKNLAELYEAEVARCLKVEVSSEVHLKTVALASDAVEGEKNVLTLEAKPKIGPVFSYPIACLCLGVQETVQVDMKFNINDNVKLVLSNGSGPISVTGMEEMRVTASTSYEIPKEHSERISESLRASEDSEEFERIFMPEAYAKRMKNPLYVRKRARNPWKFLNDDEENEDTYMQVDSAKNKEGEREMKLERHPLLKYLPPPVAELEVEQEDEEESDNDQVEKKQLAEQKAMKKKSIASGKAPAKKGSLKKKMKDKSPLGSSVKKGKSSKEKKNLY